MSDPDNLLLIGILPTASVNSIWRDIKVYNDHAYIVSEASNHGMQIFDLKRLRNVENMPSVFSPDIHYTDFGRAHNIVINEQTGYAYPVGNQDPGRSFSRDPGHEGGLFDGGPIFINIQNPTSPVMEGGFSGVGYCHDAQAVIYDGPDSEHIGKEIMNLKVKFIKGENLNNKITFKEDIETNKTYFGIGFDIHRLIRGKKLFLGGIKIPYHSGLKGHSDGDVIIHSIIDSLLGAMRKKDIGTFFPDNQKNIKILDHPKMLKPIVEILNNNDFYINNLDINLICEQPKVSKYRDKIIKSLSNLLNIDKELINLKGKTVEKLGLIGKEKAIACEVICSITQ